MKQNNGKTEGLLCAQGAQAQSAKECMYAHRKIPAWALPTQRRVYGEINIVFKSTSLQKLISSKAFEYWFRQFSSLLLAAWHLCIHNVYNKCYAKMHLLQKHWQVINNNVQTNWSFSRHVLIQEMPYNGMESGIFQWNLQIRGLWLEPLPSRLRGKHTSKFKLHGFNLISVITPSPQKESSTPLQACTQTLYFWPTLLNRKQIYNGIAWLHFLE